MREMINVNGVVVPAAEAVVPAMDHGFLFGDSIYETLRTYAGRTFRFAAHVRRLGASAAGLELEVPLAGDTLLERCETTLAAAGIADAAVRIVVTRGVGPMGLDPGPCTSPNVLVYVRPRPCLPAESTTAGVPVKIVNRARNPRAALDPNVKSGNYLNNVLAFVEARKVGAFEGIMLNAQGLVTEGCTSNLFIVRNGEVLTPPLESGLLGGITRAVVLECCANEGIGHAERAFGADDLRDCDEAFLTSTLKQVLPVASVDGMPLRSGGSGAITRRLLAAYRREVEAETGVPADEQA